MKHSGSCLCSEVTFIIDGTFEHFFLCHCGFCRKDTGAAHAANLFSSSARLRWLSGQDRVSSFTLPATRHARSFCSRCGSALPSIQLDGKLLVVPAGSLDGDVPIQPRAHVFMASKANWDHQLEKVRRLDGAPG